VNSKLLGEGSDLRLQVEEGPDGGEGLEVGLEVSQDGRHLEAVGLEVGNDCKGLGVAGGHRVASSGLVGVRVRLGRGLLRQSAQ